MASDFPVPTVPTYCTAGDVAQVLEEPPFSDNVDDGQASLTHVNGAIMAQEEVIDRWCKTAWRERRVTDEYPYDGLGNLQDWEGFVQVALKKMDVRAMSTGAGDKVEVWNGSQFEDYLVTKVQGRNGSFYLVPEHGLLKIRNHVIYGDPRDRVRVTYRYGQTAVPANIKRACALLVAAELLQTGFRSQSGQGQGTDFVPADTRATRWKAQAQAFLAPHVAIGGH